MKRKQNIFEFDREEIDFVKKVLRTGDIGPEEKKTMTAIYRMKIDPNFSVCEGCNQAIKQNFKRLCSIMAESLGVKPDQLSHYRHPVATTTVTIEGSAKNKEFFDSPFEDKAEEKQSLLNKLNPFKK